MLIYPCRSTVRCACGDIAAAGIIVFVFLSVYFVNSKLAFGFWYLPVKLGMKKLLQESVTEETAKDGSGQGQGYY